MKRKLAMTLAAVLAFTAAGIGGGTKAQARELLPIIWAEASSTLPDEYNYSYNVWNLLDGDPSTCWTEGVSGQGVGESITYYVPEGSVITGAKVLPGYYRDKEIFDKNSAPSRLTFSSGGKSVMQYMTPYATNYASGFDGCFFNLTEPLVSDGAVVITIGSVREGWKYQDTCISELHLYGDVAADYDWDDEDYDVAQDGYDDIENWDQGYDFADGYEDYENTGMGQDPSNIDENGAFTDIQLSHMSTLAMQMARIYNADLNVSMTVDVVDLTAEDRAFGLYWYQYNCDDERITANGENNTIALSDADDMLAELYGDTTTTEDLQMAIGLYAAADDGANVSFPATGDFGDAGEWYFDAPTFDGIQNGKIQLSGAIRKYDSAAQNYLQVGTYRTWYNEEATGFDGTYNIYSFNQVEMNLDGSYTEALGTGSQGASTLTYSPEELCEMALDYYENLTDYRPTQTAWEQQEDGTYIIQLYDLVVDHTSTSAWYKVDEHGVGEDWMTGEPINLNV